MNNSIEKSIHICPDCGNKYMSIYEVCPKCGCIYYDLKEKKRKKLEIPLIILGMLILSFIFWIVWKFINTKNVPTEESAIWESFEAIDETESSAEAPDVYIDDIVIIDDTPAGGDTYYYNGENQTIENEPDTETEYEIVQ